MELDRYQNICCTSANVVYTVKNSNEIQNSMWFFEIWIERSIVVVGNEIKFFNCCSAVCLTSCMSWIKISLLHWRSLQMRWKAGRIMSEFVRFFEIRSRDEQTSLVRQLLRFPRRRPTQMGFLLFRWSSGVTAQLTRSANLVNRTHPYRASLFEWNIHRPGNSFVRN